MGNTIQRNTMLVACVALHTEDSCEVFMCKMPNPQTASLLEGLAVKKIPGKNTTIIFSQIFSFLIQNVCRRQDKRVARLRRATKPKPKPFFKKTTRFRTNNVWYFFSGVFFSASRLKQELCSPQTQKTVKEQRKLTKNCVCMGAAQRFSVLSVASEN